MRSAFLLTIVFLAGVLPGQSGVALVDQEPLRARSIRSFEPFALSRSLIQSPRLISRGDATLLTWLEPDETGRDRLYSLHLRDERQQDYPLERLIRPIDEDYGDHTTSPATAMTEDGRSVAWGWLSSDTDGQVFHVRTDDSPISEIVRTPGLIEFPALEFDSEGRLYASWVQQVGGRTEGWAAYETVSGDWVSKRLNDDPVACDLIPHMFGMESGVQIFWYSLDGSDITLRASSLAAGGEPTLLPSEGTDIPAYRLPILYRSPSMDVPGALWLEPVEGGEVYMALDPRAADFPNPIIVGNIGQPPALAAVSSDAYGAMTWVERSATETTLVGQNPHGDSIRQLVSETVSSPQISVSRAWTNLAWLDQDHESGLSTLIFLRAR